VSAFAFEGTPLGESNGTPVEVKAFGGEQRTLAVGEGAPNLVDVLVRGAETTLSFLERWSMECGVGHIVGVEPAMHDLRQATSPLGLRQSPVTSTGTELLVVELLQALSAFVRVP
jgi:hypothetical protein